MSGFQFSETMTGNYHRDGRERPFSFQLQIKATNLTQFLRNRTALCEGVVDAEGLAENAACTGTVIIDPVLGRRIRYEFDFTAADGKRYHFAGQKDVSALSPVKTMTTLPAEITDPSGNVWATALVLFEARTLPGFLASFRPIL